MNKAERRECDRFDPYGEKKNINSPASLSKLKELEKQYS